MSDEYKFDEQPDPQDWMDGSGRVLEIQTDKPVCKVVPCTNADCSTDLVVNRFYAPAKARCSLHGGQKTKEIAATHLVHNDGSAPVNGALANLRCPMCGLPMVVISINSIGHVTFKCTDPTMIESEGKASRKYCMTSVSVNPRWGPLEIRSIPTQFQDLVEQFNLGQKMQYFDEIEARYPGSIK